MVRLLLQHGANPDCGVRGASLVHWACGCGNLEAARALAEHLSLENIVHLRDASGATPLHWAAAGMGVWLYIG